MRHFATERRAPVKKTETFRFFPKQALLLSVETKLAKPVQANGMSGGFGLRRLAAAFLRRVRRR
jgi:hypothetical protein